LFERRAVFFLFLCDLFRIVLRRSPPNPLQVDAGKVELEGAQYLGFNIPLDLTTLCVVEALLMGYIEVQRNTTLDPEDRCYPGGNFDPLGLADEPDRAIQLKTAEIKHSRLAMVAFLGFAVQAGFTDSTSPLENLSFLNK
jgi:light-harvesting complex II chlorophyll a/b binding protein 4